MKIRDCDDKTLPWARLSKLKASRAKNRIVLNKTEKPFSLKDDEKTVKTWKSLNSTMGKKDINQNLDNP